ncbi:pro-neuregulin-4, membrane-bound isoform [Arapaima gigas]
MAEHGEPCKISEASTYCMNGGTCYRIPSVSTLTCVCSGGYTGSRCEEYHLFMVSKMNETGGLIAAIVIVAFLILIILTIIIYFACRMWKKSHQNKSRTEYGRVKPIL